MKKTILALLALLLALSVSAWAADTYIHGYFRYTVEDGSVTITAYTGQAETVTVPAMIGGNPVNTIGTGAFASNPAVKRVNLPDTVTVIEEGAFAAGQTASFDYIVSVEKTAEGTKAVVSCVQSGAAVFCAAYDGGGRMTGVESQPVTAGQKIYSFSFGTGSAVKVFLLDAGFRPLCACETR